MLEQLYYLSGVVASLAIVASLVFVGLQLRYAADQQRTATAAGYYEIFRDHFKCVENPEIIGLFLRGLDKGPDTFTKEDRVKLNLYYTMLTRGYQVMHYQASKKVFEADFWEHTQAHLADHLDSRYYREFWGARQRHFPETFQILMNRLIEEGPSGPLLKLDDDPPPQA
ncbi:MAG: hypothetical protein RIA71_01685 [Oceanicaulis sp.]